MFSTPMEENQIIIKDLSKVYSNGFNALKNINLTIKKGEILALLGPNGAGKTTLISVICGIVTTYHIREVCMANLQIRNM